MYIENLQHHAEWYVILKHVLGGPLGRVLGVGGGGGGVCGGGEG